MARAQHRKEIVDLIEPRGQVERTGAGEEIRCKSKARIAAR